MNGYYYENYLICKSVDDFNFPVGMHDLYFDKNKEFQKCPTIREPQFANKFMAVVDEEKNEMLSCVSRSYQLIKNIWAYEKGLEIAGAVFHVSDNEISFWKGLISENRGSCEIDIKIAHELIIEACKHTWIGFVHVENSYDKTKSLGYKVGFVLDSMNGRELPLGVLLPSLSLEFRISHSWRLDTISNKLQDAIDSYTQKRKVFEEFELMVKHLLEIEVVDDEILPLFCKLAYIHSIDETKYEDCLLARKLILIERISQDWINKCGPNAYAALCAYAEFASEFFLDPTINFFGEPSRFQSQLGEFVEDLIESKNRKGESFSVDEYIGNKARTIKKKIKLICARR